LWQKKTYRGSVFSEYFGVYPVNTTHQCSILIFIYMLLLPEGQAVEEWEPAKKKAMFIRKSESIGQKVFSLLLVFKRFRIILQTLSNVKRIYTPEIQTDNNKTLL